MAILFQEALEADRVGFMRSGKILAEGDPKAMIRTLNAGTLEDVFYKLCVDSDHQNNSRLLDHSEDQRST